MKNKLRDEDVKVVVGGWSYIQSLYLSGIAKVLRQAGISYNGQTLVAYQETIGDLGSNLGVTPLPLPPGSGITPATTPWGDYTFNGVVY